MNRDNIKNRDLITRDIEEAVRKALRAGYSTEQTIRKRTGLHWIEVQAALRILMYHREVESNNKPEKYHGIVPSTWNYRTRKEMGLVLPRDSRGHYRKKVTIRQMRAFFNK
jgi:hypothetical protein